MNLVDVAAQSLRDTQTLFRHVGFLSTLLGHLIEQGRMSPLPEGMTMRQETARLVSVLEDAVPMAVTR